MAFRGQWDFHVRSRSPYRRYWSWQREVGAYASGARRNRAAGTDVSDLDAVDRARLRRRFELVVQYGVEMTVSEQVVVYVIVVAVSSAGQCGHSPR